MESGNQKTNIAFQEIFAKFQEQLERFDKNNSELVQIGNKFMDDSSDVIKESEKGNINKSHPGLLKDLDSLLERLQGLNTSYGRQISKLQTII